MGSSGEDQSNGHAEETYEGLVQISLNALRFCGVLERRWGSCTTGVPWSGAGARSRLAWRTKCDGFIHWRGGTWRIGARSA